MPVVEYPDVSFVPVKIELLSIVQPPAEPPVLSAVLTVADDGGVYPTASDTFALLTFEFKVFAVVKVVPPT